MKCKKCNSTLLSLYYRENNINKRNWAKIRKWKYCPKCKNIVEW